MQGNSGIPGLPSVVVRNDPLVSSALTLVKPAVLNKPRLLPTVTNSPPIQHIYLRTGLRPHTWICPMLAKVWHAVAPFNTADAQNPRFMMARIRALSDSFRARSYTRSPHTMARISVHLTTFTAHVNNLRGKPTPRPLGCQLAEASVPFRAWKPQTEGLHPGSRKCSEKTD